MKFCPCCKQTKPFTEFYTERRNKNGCSAYCRDCTKIKLKESYQRRKPKILAYQRRYTETHKEKISEYHKAYAAIHRDQIRINAKRHYYKDVEVTRAKRRVQAKKTYYAHHEVYKEYSRLYQHSLNPEQVRISHRIYWKTHNKECCERSRKYRKQFPEKFRPGAADKENRRRAKLRQAPIIEKVDRLAVYMRDGGKCHICHRRVSQKTFTLDHLIPIVASGPHAAFNLAVAHRSCNSRRGPGRIPAQLRLLG